MNNFLLSMIIALDSKSLDVDFYKKVLTEFVDGFGYHLQIDGEPFDYYAFEQILKICYDLQIKDIGVRTSKKITKDDISLLKKYNIRSIMFKHDCEFIEETFTLDGGNLNCITNAYSSSLTSFKLSTLNGGKIRLSSCEIKNSFLTFGDGNIMCTTTTVNGVGYLTMTQNTIFETEYLYVEITKLELLNGQTNVSRTFVKYFS